MTHEVREFSSTGSTSEFFEHDVEDTKQNVAFGAYVTMSPEDGWIKFEGACNVGDHVNICGAGGVVIGDGVTIDSGVTIMSRGTIFSEDGKSRLTEFGRVVIGKNAYIGARAVILHGINIGAGAIIFPGAIVAHNVPENGCAMVMAAQVVSQEGMMEAEEAAMEPETAPEERSDGMPELIGSDD